MAKIEKHIPNSIIIPMVIADLEAGNTVTLQLYGNSMLPFLHDGRDKALLKKASSPRVGDPVLAEIEPKRYVLHRIVAIENDAVTLLGDGNLTPEHCLLSDIKASVIGFYRKGRTDIDLISSKKWRIYSAVWMALRPVRRYLLAVYRRVAVEN